jgi:hypothetical protein
MVRNRLSCYARTVAELFVLVPCDSVVRHFNISGSANPDIQYAKPRQTMVTRLSVARSVSCACFTGIVVLAVPAAGVSLLPWKVPLQQSGMSRKQQSTQQHNHTSRPLMQQQQQQQ